jgi:L-ascorbate 6-phosphate lactonase
MKFIDVLAKTDVMPASVVVFWLGQAGFLLKTADKKLILIDPYLSDSLYDSSKTQNGYAFKRMTPVLFEPDEVNADLIFCSHEHADHLDTGSIAALLKNEGTRLYTNPASVRLAKRAGAPSDRIQTIHRGTELDFGEFRLTALAAQHGDLSPEAMGFLFDFGFIRIYYSGDTAYDLPMLAPALKARPELVLLPINGAYGNLNAVEAAKLANNLGAKVCIPHHFWTFPIHLGSPQEFIGAMAEYAPGCELHMLTPGEPFRVL